MNFFKELFTLTKLLFTKQDNCKIETVSMKYFPAKGYAYMMWCGKLIYREENTHLIKPSDVDINHESIHIAQAKDRGSWIMYYLSYAWNWLIENPITKPSNSAYYTNKYEVEAYAKEEDMTYLLRREKNFVDRFKLKNGKKLYKEYKSSYYFKKEIKYMFFSI